ncbi:MAG: heme-binding Shp domain-containing protein [Eubacteriales bacterium]|nr:heme-binding Shp domain-containing protein [Eubacteriales bacterium]
MTYAEKKSKTKRNLLACLLAGAVLLAGLPAEAQAAEESSKLYTVTVTGHYRDPQTQEISDSGGEDNAALGESMVGSVVDPTGLLTETEDGDWTLSLRFHLMNNISNVAFQAQAEGESGWSEASFQKTGSGDDTGDFCVLLPAESSTLKAECYVDAMGRDVVFFLTYGDRQEGNTTDLAEAGSFDAVSSGAGLDEADGLVIGTAGSGASDGGQDAADAGDAGEQEAALTGEAGSIRLGDSVWVTLFGILFCSFLLAGLVLLLIAGLLIYIYFLKTGILEVRLADPKRRGGARGRKADDPDEEDWEDETDDDLDLGFLDDEDEPDDEEEDG